MSIIIKGNTVFGPRLITPSGGYGALLLDTYTGAVAAYSLRKLSTSYAGNCIRVRRSSDNTEQDFGFSSGVLDTASLLTFVGANNGFVVTWYDQSGNGNNQTQATATSQPKIVSSGSIITQNSKPCLQLDGTDDYMYNNTTGLIRLDQRSHFYVLKETTAKSYAGFISYAPALGENDFSNINGGNSNSGDGAANGQFTINGYTSAVGISGTKPTPYSLFSQYNDATTQYAQKNNGTYSSSSHGYTANKYNTGALFLGLRFLGAASTAYTMNGIIQEMIIYNGNTQNANIAAINTNINTFYSIY